MSTPFSPSHTTGADTFKLWQTLDGSKSRTFAAFRNCQCYVEKHTIRNSPGLLLPDVTLLQRTFAGWETFTSDGCKNRIHL